MRAWFNVCTGPACALVLMCVASHPAEAGPYAPAAGATGSDAVPAGDPRIVAWASAVASIVRGPQGIFDPESDLASFGAPAKALGPADVDVARLDPYTAPVVSLGDGGVIVLNFAQPIRNGPGPDLAVFENSFSDTFLELAFVSVSSDGVIFTRFPCVSLTPTADIHEDLGRDDFSELDPTNLYNLAGKYRGGYGTPFDLNELTGTPGLDLNNIVAVKIEDVVGSVDGRWARRDSLGNIIKDPFPTEFASSGFDLDAVAVLRAVPEPAISTFLIGTAAYALARRRR